MFVIVLVLVIFALWLCFTIYRHSCRQDDSAYAQKRQVIKYQHDDSAYAQMCNKQRSHNDLYGAKEARPKARQTTYEYLLNTDEWKKKRIEVINAHGNKCDWCGSRYNLQVHHKYYFYDGGGKWLPWDYEDKVFMCLCERCHRTYHQKYQVKTFFKKHIGTKR